MTAIGHTNASRITFDHAIELAVATGVAVLVAIGFVTSYETLRSLAVTDGGFAPWLAPAVPLSFDLGIVVLSLEVVAAARQGRHALVHRALVAALSVATVAVNSTASTGIAGQLLHAIPPAMFVICFEGLIADARRGAMAGRPGQFRPWKAAALSPLSSYRAWRHDVLRSASLDPIETSTAKSPVRARRLAPSTTQPSSRAVPPTKSTAVGRDDRVALVRQTLREHPGFTAPALARALHEHGYEVSVRTAQRLRARAVENR